jgi:two-component system, LytTR family, response regulator
MRKLTALIVDDELHGRESLINLLKTYCPEIEIAGEAESASEAKKLVYEKNPDVVFLDINMPEMDGFDFLESMPYKNFSVVIVTAFMEYGIRAVKAQAVDYILKPVSIKELQQCVKKLVEMQALQNAQVDNGIKSNKSNKVVLVHFQGFSIHDINEIVRFEANDNYTKVFLNGKKPLTISRPLKHFEECCGDTFYRIHKSHLINLEYLKEFSHEDGGIAVMKDGTRIAVSRRRVTDFIEKVKKIN